MTVGAHSCQRLTSHMYAQTSGTSLAMVMRLSVLNDITRTYGRIPKLDVVGYGQLIRKLSRTLPSTVS